MADAGPAAREVDAGPGHHQRIDGLVPVHAIWHPEVGPMLSLGMLTASARAHRGGSLATRFDIRRPEPASEALHLLEAGDGPAVLLLSNYIWSLDDNLRAARAAKARRPQLIVVHGGPSTPKYPADAERFLRTHRDVADVLVHGEGEATLCELLEAFASAGLRADPRHLARIAGISFTDESGRVTHTQDRPRIADLDDLPSPYLSGEFDDIEVSAWNFLVSIETNRGCPYGCTFCDWGSATRSRIRKFSLDRIAAEIEWCAARGVEGIQLCDANFGILPRDADVAGLLAAARVRTGAPTMVAFTPAKNTQRHLRPIFDQLLAADIQLSTAISLQTTDPETLALVDRSNISTDAYLSLAADLRRRGQTLQGDVLIGMPGQTYDTYRTDLQFFMDHDISPRTWSLRVLPNAPMNHPDYRATHQIQVGSDDLVTSTATMSADDRRRMQALRKAQWIGWRYGLLRHVMHVVQWDHGIPATDVLEAVTSTCEGAPTSYPSLSWTFEHFDLYQVPAGGWPAFYRDVRRLLDDRFGVGSSPALATALAVQEAVMPAPGRTFPHRIALDHDYVSYLRSAMGPLYESGAASRPAAPLATFGPASLTVVGDPDGIGTLGTRLRGDPRSEVLQGDFWIASWVRYELPTDPPIPAAATPLRSWSPTEPAPPPHTARVSQPTRRAPAPS